jgi:hypothetical protein
MKQLILTTVLCVCAQFLTWGSSNSIDSLNIRTVQPALKIEKTRVYDGKTLLSKNEVLNVLSAYPKIAAQYEKGKKLRSTGGVLIPVGLVTFVGGVVLMVNGFDEKTSSYGYYSIYTRQPNGNYYLGLVIGTIGELMVDGGIVCSIIGKTNIRRSITNYNRAIKSTSQYVPGQINYQLGLLDNGNFGLKLTF